MEIAIFKDHEMVPEVPVSVDKETVWLSQAQMSQLFGKDQSVIARHIGNVFKEGEAEEESINLQKYTLLMLLFLSDIESNLDEA